jgi:Uncharacterized conserved protein, contains double-stranded beta-helix domain
LEGRLIMAKNEELKTNGVFPVGDKNDAYAKYFIGQSYLNGLVKPEDNIDFGVGNVTFEPGCRNDWHIHHDGFQILLVTGGEGWYQEWGKPAQLLKQVTSLLLKKASNTGMEQLRIVGSVMLLLLKELQNGLKRLLMKNMTNCKIID